MRRRSPSEARTPRGATRGGGWKRGGQSTTGGRATRHIEERRGSNGVCVQRVGFSRVVRAGRSRVLGRVLGFRGAPPTRGPRARGRASPCPRVPPSSRRSGARHPPARRGSWETGRSYEYLVRFAREGNDGGLGRGWDGPASGARSPPASADPRRERREGRGPSLPVVGPVSSAPRGLLRGSSWNSVNRAVAPSVRHRRCERRDEDRPKWIPSGRTTSHDSRKSRRKRDLSDRPPTLYREFLLCDFVLSEFS